MSKGCKSFAVDLSAYFDGELEGDSLRHMEAHLADCAGCRDTLKRFSKLRSALHALARPPRRGSILEDLQSRLAEEDEPAGEAGKPLVC
jgi:anti-sigma factor RsiW